MRHPLPCFQLLGVVLNLLAPCYLHLTPLYEFLFVIPDYVAGDFVLRRVTPPPTQRSGMHFTPLPPCTLPSSTVPSLEFQTATPAPPPDQRVNVCALATLFWRFSYTIYRFGPSAHPHFFDPRVTSLMRGFQTSLTQRQPRRIFSVVMSFLGELSLSLGSALPCSPFGTLFHSNPCGSLPCRTPRIIDSFFCCPSSALDA